MDFNSKPADRQMPSGTVTFLFTDIEGSTALAQNYPDEINTLLDQHHAILRQSIETNHGTVFEIVGDAFAAAFFTGNDALNAAIDAQQKLLQETWRPVPLKVRMGIHTGTAQATVLLDLGDNYQGYLTLTRVQRIMSAAHGGQILLSSASAELVRGQLPKDTSLRDLGEYRLKGLVNPERLWQVNAPGLASDFPSLRSLNAIPNNLPAQTTAFIGRETELNAVVKRLNTAGTRLVTLTGPGGIGKTRLAVQAAAELIEGFHDGVYFIDLAPIRDPEFFPTEIAQTLGLRETSDLPLLEALTGQLRQKQMLLLLDNFEQVTAAAPEVATLLRECPELKLLVTSREALHVRGEQVFPVSPLAMPKIDVTQPTIEQLTQYEAVRLFIERAQAVQPDFEITNENAPAVAEICWRLDGLPLAIELATGRLKLFSPQALLERLGSRLKFLRGGARDLPARQQTLRDAITWSYELLDPGEQRLFQILSAFQGCTVEAVEMVVGALSLPEANDLEPIDLLYSLVDKSLIRQVDADNGEPRLVMLETIREFAAERLHEDVEFYAAIQRTHAAYYADFTRRQWEFLTGREREAASKRLLSDIENVRAAWGYWVEAGDLEQLSKFVDSLLFLYDRQGWYQSTVKLTNDLLDIISTAPSTPELVQQEMILHTSLARALLVIKGYTPEVEEAFAQALDLSQKVGEVSELFPVLRGLFSFYTLRGEFDKGIPLGEKILALAKRYDDIVMYLDGHYILGTSLVFIGKFKPGFEHLEKAISLFDPERLQSGRFRVGNYPGVASYVTSAMASWGLGYPDRALKRANEAVNLARKIGHPYSLAFAMFHLGLIHFWRREIEPSLAYTQEVLDIAAVHELQIWDAVGTCLQGIGFASLGRAESGLTQIERGMDLYQGLKSPPIFWPMLRSFQSVACGLAGKPEQGLELLEEAVAHPSQGYGNVLLADQLRMKGDLLRLLPSPDPSEAEKAYLSSLALAQEQGAAMVELRTALGLFHLWREAGQVERGRHLLQTAYDKMTEGFDTGDMIEARSLLEQDRA